MLKPLNRAAVERPGETQPRQTRQYRRQFIRNAFGEIAVGGVATHGRKGNDSE